MIRVLVAGLVLPLAMVLGCENHADHAGSGPGSATQKDQHDHEADGHEGHEHGPGDAAHEHHAGEQHDLGTAKVGEFEVKAAYSGIITPGKKVDVDLAIQGERAKVVAIRAWIGAEDAKGSIKSRVASEGEHHHAEVEVPEPLPPGAAVWVEIETDQGARQSGSFALKP